MSNNGLELWRKCVKDHYEKKGETYKVPKKDSTDYNEIKKDYESKKNGKIEDKPIETKTKCKNCKSFKCRCQCPYPKAK